MLLLAEQLWPADRAAAANASRLSLARPASYCLPHPLLKFAETDYPFAEARFREALAACARGEIENSDLPVALPRGRRCLDTPRARLLNFAQRSPASE